MNDPSSAMYAAMAFLTSRAFLVCYCLLIAFFFLKSIADCLAQKRTMVRDISEGERILRECHGEDPGADRRARFAERLESVSERIGKIGLLKGKWVEFRESLLAPAGGGGPVLASLPAESFFGEDGLVPLGYDERHFSSVPNYLTGIGILGTFLGITSGIHLIDVKELLGASPGAAGVAGKSIEPLLRGAGLAFLTSVVGLTLSITFSIAEKSVYRKITRSLSSFNGLLDASVVRLSPEALAKRHLDLLDGLRLPSPDADGPRLSVQTELGTVVPRFLEGFEASVGGVLARTVADTLKGELANIAGILSTIHTDRSLETSNALRAMAEAFLRSIQGATSEVIETVAGNLRRAAEECAPMARSLREVNQVIAVNIKAAGSVAADVRQAASEMTAVAAAFGEAAAVTARAVASASEAAEGLAERNARISEAMERAVERTLDGQMAAVSLLNEELARLGASVAAGMDGAGQRAEALFAEVGARMGETREAALKVAESAAAAVAEAACARIDGLGARFDASVSSVSDALAARAGAGLDGLLERISAEASRIPQEAGRIADALRLRVDEIGKGIEVILSAAAKGQEDLGLALAGRIDRCGESINRVLSGMAEAQGGLHGQLMLRLDGFDRRVADMLAGAGAGLDGLREQLSAEASRIPQEAGRIAGELLQRMDEIGKGLEGILSAAAKGQDDLGLALAGRIDRCGESLNGVISGMAEAQGGLHAQLMQRLDGYDRRVADMLAGAGAGLDGLRERISAEASRIPQEAGRIAGELLQRLDEIGRAHV
jgi:hypothetical protein